MTDAPRKPYVPLDEEDPVDGMIRRTGCEMQYRAMETCMVDTDRNFRACQVLNQLVYFSLIL